MELYMDINISLVSLSQHFGDLDLSHPAPAPIGACGTLRCVREVKLLTSLCLVLMLATKV